MKKSQLLCSEIDKCGIGANDACIYFKNGSWIRVVTASDSGRSARANCIIVDEFRMVDEKIITTVLRKFLTAPRQPKYLEKKEYKHLAERNKEFYMSSCWYKSHYSYLKARSYVTGMLDDRRKYFICGLPYQIAIKEGLLSKEQVQDEMMEEDFDELAWYMEMDALFYSDTDGKFFTFDDISKRRVLKNAIYPTNYISSKTLKIPDLLYGERRIISVDVALMSSKKHKNDASAIIINSAIPNGDNEYISNNIYLASYEGLTTSELALIVRRLFDMYKCTDIALDTNGVGLGVFDALVKDIYDPEIDGGKTYKALDCCNDENMSERCKVVGAEKVIWSIKATDTFNSQMSNLLRNAFKSNKINLLVSEYESIDILRERFKGYDKLDFEDQVKLKLPYIQTTLLINELIKLDHKVSGNKVKLTEQSGERKDRYSALLYNYAVQYELSKELITFNSDYDFDFVDDEYYIEDDYDDDVFY